MDPVLGSTSGLRRHQDSVIAGNDQYKPAGFLENDAVSIGLRCDRSQDSIRLEIENDDCAAPVADESPSDIGNQSNTMVVLLAGNVGNRLPRIRIDHHRVSGSGNVESVIFGIQGDIVHSAVTTNVKRLLDRPIALGGNAGAKSERDHRDQKANRYIPRVHSILL